MKINTFIVLLFVSISPLASGDEKSIAKENMKYLITQNDILQKLDKNQFLEYADTTFTNINYSKIEKMIGESFDFSFTEDGFEGKSQNFKYYVNDDKSALYFYNYKKLPSDISSDAYVPEDIIRDRVMSDLETLGVQNTKDLDIKIRQLMRQIHVREETEADAMPAKAIAYKVFIYRKIGESIIYQQKIIMSYYLDGTVQKVALRWPDIDQGSHMLNSQYSVDQLVDNIDQQLQEQEHPFLWENKPFDLDIGLGIKDGVLKRVLYIKDVIPKGFGKIRQFSAWL